MNLSGSLRFCGVRCGALVLVVLLALLLPAGASAAEPTKAEAVGILRNLFSALLAQDYQKAVTFFQTPTGATPADLQKAVARLIELKEISAPGIDVLEAKGKWGKLNETVEPARAERFAAKFGVPAADCYGLTLGNAEAGFFWDGKQLKVIRCDDIGNLTP